MNKFYISTSIVYTNAPPHIGFMLELIQADVVARFNRQKGKEVLFSTGTDEHGEKIARRAREEGEEPQKFVDKITEEYRRLIEKLEISNDCFIRTTDHALHWPSVEKIWGKIKDNGDIYKKKYEGLYCVGCEAFLREKELRGGKCINHNKEPELIKEENYFFRLSRYQEKIKEAIQKDEVCIIPQSRKNEIMQFINEGLEDISVSRSKKRLEWGIPVPGDNSQTLYVWMDALTNYISVLDYKKEGKLFQKFWPADVHCIGKDILRFHAVIWLGMLLSAGLELPRKIFVHGFINVEGRKMSKSLGNVVDPFNLIDNYGVNAVRYFFLREISPTEDGDFSRNRFIERYNKDLADGLGNLVSRTIALSAKENISVDSCKVNGDIMERVEKTKKKTAKLLESFKFNEALVSIWKLIHFSDKYIEEKKPWEGKEGSKKTIHNLLFIINSLSELIFPFMPEVSREIKKRIKEKEKSPLFPRIEDF